MTRHGRVLDRGLSGHAVAEAVKRAVARVGLDPSEYSGHSMRAGLVASAAMAGVSEGDIARTSRHVSVPTLRSYIRPATVFSRNAAAAVL